MKLIAYFSASGRTKKRAETLAEELNGQLYEITPAIKYTKKDLNWLNKNSRSSIEMRNKEYRPEIVNGKIDVSLFDEIYLGFPIWWGVAPTIVNTFLEANDFTGKTIYLFATSGSSKFANTAAELQASAPQTTFIEYMLNGKKVK